MTRQKLIEPLIVGKDVLDVGSAGEDSSLIFWKFLKTHTNSLTGIDTRPVGEPGVVVGNMETYLFGRRFDIIVAGDVLIQTDNQGLFLENCAVHLKPGGKLVLTLPNAKWPTVLFRPSPYQTGWHDQFTLAQLLTRHNFMITQLHFYQGNRPTFRFLRFFPGYRQAMLAVCTIKTEK